MLFGILSIITVTKPFYFLTYNEFPTHCYIASLADIWRKSQLISYPEQETAVDGMDGLKANSKT